MADTYIKIWDTYESYFEPLSAAEVGRLVLAMMKYKSSGMEPELNGNERYVWPAIKRDLIKDAEKKRKKKIRYRLRLVMRRQRRNLLRMFFERISGNSVLLVKRL